MTELPPADEGREDNDRLDDSQDTFEREIEGELSELRDELGVNDDEWGDADEFAPAQREEPVSEPVSDRAGDSADQRVADSGQDAEESTVGGSELHGEAAEDSSAAAASEDAPPDDSEAGADEPRASTEAPEAKADEPDVTTGAPEAKLEEPDAAEAAPEANADEPGSAPGDAEAWPDGAATANGEADAEPQTPGVDTRSSEPVAGQTDLPETDAEPPEDAERESSADEALVAETKEADALGEDPDASPADAPGVPATVAAAPGAPGQAGATLPAAGAPPAAATAVGGAYAPVAEIDVEIENERRPVAMWAKFLAGSMVVIVSIATAVSVTILLGLTALADGIRPSTALEAIDRGDLTAVEAGEPQTILLIGSDERSGDNARGRSDTAMLVRLDPEKELISLFSLPRDLRANIPGVGVDRLNAAYAIGGPTLALKTIRQLTGLEINHVVDVSFTGFAKAVDAVDCAYVDVDRDYFNDNSSGGDRFAAIDINAGYQRLCGFKALQYVRFRHTDNDVVRGARQQDFVREVRPKIPTGDLVLGGLLPGFSSGRGEELIEIFKKHTTSTIKGADNLIDLLAVLVASRNSSINEIRFEGQLSGSYVTASNQEMESSVARFLGEDPPPTPTDEAAAAETKAERAADRKAARKTKKKREKDPTSGVELVNVSEEGRRFAEIVDEAGTLGMPVEYPTRLPPGATISEDSRGYLIKDPDGVKHPSYKFVMAQSGPGITEYFGVMGTPWKEAPILEHPSETREIDGAIYKLYFTGERLRMIAWETQQAAYWINNTLLQSLTEQQMIAIATSMGTFR